MLKEKIESSLGLRALHRPTFYCNPGGLRFELSAGGSPVEQFLTAHRKASAICREVFDRAQTFTVCMSVYLYKPAFSFRDNLRKLRLAGIRIPRSKAIWVALDGDGDGADDGLLHVAFAADRALLDNFLWCALATDLTIEPCPHFSAIRLIDLDKAVLVHPYDDRGMDVVGPNHALLSELYSKFNVELLEYDRHTMAATFG